MRNRRRYNDISLQDELSDQRLDYEAGKRSGRFQRRRRGIPSGGAGADWHYRNEGDFFYIAEVARDMDRNDPVVGQLVTRAMVNTVSTGFNLDPDCGDKGADAEIKARWLEEAADPDLCDVAGELTFHEQEEMALHEVFVPGDVFVVPMKNGTVEFREFHRCRSPSKTKRSMVHGVELDRSTRRRLRYYFTNEPIDPLSNATIKSGDLTPIAARDSEGEANVFHVYSPKRPSQTRGVSALAPIIVSAGMFDDLNFSHLLKAQLNTHWIIARNRGIDFNSDSSAAGGVPAESFTGTRRIDETSPGMEIAGEKGETIVPWSPNTPNAEFFAHARLILTLMGINLGMPLVLLLMDASETNFSGFRGAVDQARMGFKRNQRILMARFHRPYYRFKLNFWADSDPTLGALREKFEQRFYKHQWNAPGWPYIEPTKDAMADLVRAAHMQTSPRRLCHERGGMEWPEIVSETVEDRALAIEAAAKKALDINKKFSLDDAHAVSWRDLAPLPLPERVTVSLNAEPEKSDESAAAKPRK